MTGNGGPVTPEGGFGLYLHWPFCAAKCPYCDFNSHVATRIDHAAWREAYLSELRRSAQETEGRVLSTVYFGGGTPSLMEPDTVAAIMNEVRRLWPMTNDPEVTLEANPGSVEARRFAGYRSAGVNRVSLGVQAMDDADLRALGRIHSVSDARAALEIARSEFDRVSFDLIYARQGQSLAMWAQELDEALSLETDHLSLYQLTVEPGTVFDARAQRGLLRGMPDEDLAADLYALTSEACRAAGMPGYEVSNHARPGAESRHNLIYWRGGDWIGIGPGAHGRITKSEGRFATETETVPTRWIERVQEFGTGETLRWQLSATDTAEEFVMMGMRLDEGIDLVRLKNSAYRLDELILEELEAMGLIWRKAQRLGATSEGRVVLNAILRQLLVN